MKLLSPLSLIPVVAAAALLTGCDSWIGYRHVHYDPSNQPPPGSAEQAPPPSRRNDADDADDADGGHHVREVRGTVESVDPDEQAILIRPGDGGGDRDGRDDRDLVIHYDEETQVEFQGRTFGVESLERGDQISAAVERGSDGLLTQAIRVLHDVRGGAMEGNRGDDRGGSGEEPGGPAATELRGVVRSNNSSRQTLEVEQAGSKALVVVGYDDDTDVEFQGRHYSPDNLEKGDAVEIELREEGGQPVADHILVVGEGRPVRT